MNEQQMTEHTNTQSRMTERRTAECQKTEQGWQKIEKLNVKNIKRLET